MQRSRLTLVTPANVETIIQSEGVKPSQLEELIRSSFRPYRKDRSAIFVDTEAIKKLPDLPTVPVDWVDEDQNIHWTGIQRRAQSKKWSRVLVGDYFQWFFWFMRWQRFNAFHSLVLVNPIEYMLAADQRGYIDGLLTRLLTRAKVNRIFVIETPENQERLRRWIEGGKTAFQSEVDTRFTPNEFHQLLLALLCGTRLTDTQLLGEATHSFWFSVNSDIDMAKEILGKRWLYDQRGPFYHLSDEGTRVIECRSDIPESQRELPPEIDRAFQLKAKHKLMTLDRSWLKEQVMIIAQELGSFTIPMLASSLSSRLREGQIDLPERMREEFRQATDEQTMELMEPPLEFLRKITGELVSSGSMVRTTWHLEVGRPAILYSLPERLPLSQEGRCGQCAFYMERQRRCGIWWPLNKRIGHFQERWGSYAPLISMSHFDIYKMKNSGRISPRASACLQFLDKKRDYMRKSVPERCDICNKELAKGRFVLCGNCGTRYFSLSKRVRVYPAYEHKFRTRYRAIAGREADADYAEISTRFPETNYQILETKLYERRRAQARAKEAEGPTVVLFPGDPFEITDTELILSRAGGRKSLPFSGLTVVDYGRLFDKEAELLKAKGVTVWRNQRFPTISKEKYRIRPELRESLDKLRPKLAKIFAVAMARSAINSTQNIALLARANVDLPRIVSDQARFLQKEESASSQSTLLTCEAMIMKRYWECYDKGIDMVFERFGPRKKSRFVREYSVDPAARAKGYTAVDAAINYLHQRRLLKCGLVNAELGLGWESGDGLLHRRSQNSRGMGLLLDLADPVKFGDREVLLQAFLESRLNWRDFKISMDRMGSAYYYPSASAIVILEHLGDRADNSLVHFRGAKMTLESAYRSSTAGFVEALRSGNADALEAFVFVP